MKLRSSPVLGLICLGSILAMDTQLDCKDVAASGLLDALWYNAAVSASNANTQAQIAAAEDELSGKDTPGVNCWDLNGNGKNDPDEDVNEDGEFNALDCQGADGANGEDGQSGKGTAGTAGINCWDLNGNGKNDPDEDVNDDGEFNALDCQGATGQSGTPGTNGTNGQDLTGVIARGWIPGADYDVLPSEVGATYVPATGKAVGIVSVTRPEPEAGNPNVPMPGDYIVRVQLPERAEEYTRDELAVLLSVEARRLDGEPGPLYQLYGYWQILPSSLNGNTIVGDTVDLRILIKAGVYMIPADGNFTIVVMVP